jgi:exopolyphosphatase/guanosine-5'-triphosphate,3'-diphosphate pyrophosphatase
VDYLMQRFDVDALQASRVSQTALHLFDQVDTQQTDLKSARQRLMWASQLHEVGSIVSHNDLPIHGAYMLGHVDAPGFSIDELHVLSQLVLGQRGKLKKVDAMLVDTSFAKQLLCLRLACLLCHARKTPDLNTLKLRCDAHGYTLRLHPTWAQHFPQSIWLLEEEVKYWARTETLLHIEGI